jgi:AraC-like DNA-binding protein
MFFYICVVYATSMSVLAILFIVLKVPEDPILRNYRACRKILASLYFSYALCGVAALAFHREFGDILENYLSLGLIFSSLIIAAGAFVFTTLVNADYLKRRTVVLALAPTFAFSTLLLTLLIGGGGRNLLKIVYVLFTLYFAGQIVLFVRLVLYQVRWAKERMDNYYSGREGEFFSWIRPIGVLFLMDSLVSLACFVFPSWSLLIPSLLFSGTAYFIIAVKLFNYVYDFELVKPVLAPESGANSFASARPPRAEARGEDRRQRNSKLAGLDVQAFIEKLEGHMRRAKPYLDPQLTVETLSRSLGISAYQLSEVLNYELGINFRNYVNSFRIADAKRLLSEGGELNILEVAFECGFNSKSPFNAAFVKETGMTPREWRTRAVAKA